MNSDHTWRKFSDGSLLVNGDELIYCSLELVDGCQKTLVRKVLKFQLDLSCPRKTFFDFVEEIPYPDMYDENGPRRLIDTRLIGVLDGQIFILDRYNSSLLTHDGENWTSRTFVDPLEIDFSDQVMTVKKYNEDR